MKKIKRFDYLLITFVCALVTCIIAFYIKGIGPLGKNCLLTIDFFHQYGPMMAELYDRIIGGKSLLYSFSFGLGLPFFRNFFNYLSSPFNIIMLLFSRENIVTSMSIIIGLKAVMASCTTSYYLNNKFGKNYLFIPLSILYGFSAYYVAYYFNIMWLDGAVLIPLITLGIEKLIDENKKLLYVVSLAMALISNYFIGYMLCIYSVLYFLMYLILNNKKHDNVTIIKRCISFGVLSLIAGGICALELIPLYSALTETSAVSDSIPTSLYYSFTLKEFLFNHLSNVGSTVLSSDSVLAPNISVGVISVSLLIAFLINKKISLKTKLCYLGLLFVIGISFFIPVLDFIWHAMHVPNDLPYRFSFIYSFVLIVICAYSVRYIKHIERIDGSLIYMGTLLFIMLARKFSSPNINVSTIYINLGIITIAYALYMLSKYRKLKYVLIALLCALSITDRVLLINRNWNIDYPTSNFYEDYKDVVSLTSIIDNKEFYRVDRDYLDRFNDPSWYGYRGVVGFSSMEYEDLTLFMHYSGVPSNEINSFAYRYNTPIYNMMFDLKYIIGENNLNYYEKLADGEYYNLYRFKYNPSLMYAVNSDVKSYLDEVGNPLYNQNEFVRLTTGISDTLKEMEVYNQETIYQDDSHTIVKYYVKGNKDNYYMHLDHSDVDFLVVDNKMYYLNNDHDYGIEKIDMEIDEFIDYNEKHIITSSNSDGDIVFYVGYNFYDGDVYDIYELDNDKWNSAYEYFEKNRITVTDYSDTEFNVSTNFNENKTIYTSIPYDKGWSVFIDGKQVNTFKIGDAMLGFDVGKGKHDIRIEYHLPYLKLSSLITILSIASLILINGKKHK